MASPLRVEKGIDAVLTEQVRTCSNCDEAISEKQGKVTERCPNCHTPINDRYSNRKKAKFTGRR